MENKKKPFIIINETPHYPITFARYSDLLDFASEDGDIKHPLGAVYRAKIAHPDNKVRIVVLKNNSMPYNTSGQALIFDKSTWLKYRNPFSPEYDATKTIIDDKVSNIREGWLKAYRPAARGVVSRVRLARRMIVNKIRSQIFK